VLNVNEPGPVQRFKRVAEMLYRCCAEERKTVQELS